METTPTAEIRLKRSTGTCLMFAGLLLMFTTLLQCVASVISPYASLIAPHEHHSPYKYDSTESALVGMLGLMLIFLGALVSSKGPNKPTDAHQDTAQPQGVP